MDTKLTLKLDEFVIAEAKKYASEHKRSLSRLIESYLKSLIHKDEDPKKMNEISPFVKSIATGVKFPDSIDDKEDYGDYLSNKYK